MSIADSFGHLLNIDPRGVSKRLVFVKPSASDAVWHIGDASLVTEETPTRIVIMALHGGTVTRHTVVDSLVSIEIATGRNVVGLCSDCVDEFRLAHDVIQAKPETKFTNFYDVYEESKRPKGELTQ